MRISPNGYLMTSEVTAPADAEVEDSTVSWYLDDTAAAAKVHFKGKDSAGTVFDYSLPGTAAAGGSNQQLQWNNGGNLDGMSGSAVSGSQLTFTNTGRIATLNNGSQAGRFQDGAGSQFDMGDGTGFDANATGSGNINAQTAYYVGGVGGVLSHTVPLGPLTGGGTTGSLVFSGGILISYTDPT